MTQQDVVSELLESIGMGGHALGDDVAHIEVHENEVVGVHLVPGFEVDAESTPNGISAQIRVCEGAEIKRPVHICFGMLPEDGEQFIELDIRAEEGSSASVLAHCTFPNARNIEHKMKAHIEIAPNASYKYFERHVHGEHGGVLVLPKAKVVVHEGAEFTTEFELLKGRAGKIDIEYDAICHARSILEMTARINGRADDNIKINEIGHLIGEDARAALISHLALRDAARADILNTLTANARGARGHVDCKEIVLGEALAKAVPIVEVNHPAAHITHEAAIGSVDSKQLQTLMARGLDEDEATEIIIEGLLSKK
jgi:hypothetical protein